MPIRETAWPEGTPTWVDLGVEDLEAAQSFYTGLFGWEYLSGGEESGGYLLAQIGGKAVAGLGPKQDQSMPTFWTTYIGATDVDATSAAATEAGGQVIAEPFDVMDSGRMAIAADPVGAVFGIWQARTHIGAERFNEHGALCWNELHTRRFDEALAFYTTVFGGEFNDISGEGFQYATFKRAGDGQPVSGVHHDTDLPDGAPDYWLAWFAVDDVDASATVAGELGATMLMPIMDSPFGRMTVVKAPQGEVFGIITLPPTSG